MKKIIKSAKERGMAVGTFTDSAETMKMWMERWGAVYLLFCGCGIFAEACKSLESSLTE